MISLENTQLLFAWAGANKLALFPIHAWHKSPGEGRFHNCKLAPMVRNPLTTDYSFDPKQWRTWYNIFMSGCNFGIVCGPSRLIVVDIDIDPATGQSYQYYFDLWCKANGITWIEDWVCVRSPSGGLHVYFKTPDDRKLRQPDLVKRKINVRAGNGYVVAPWCRTDPTECLDGSVKKAGVYEPFGGLRSIPLSSQPLLDHCKKEEYAQPQNRSHPENAELHSDGLPLDLGRRYQIGAVLEDILGQLRLAQMGSRNNALNIAAVRIGHYIAADFIDRDRAYDILMAEGINLGLEVDECRKTIASGINHGSTEPAEEPRSAIPSLLATISQLAILTPARAEGPLRPAADVTDSRPIVEKLVEPGRVTILSGGFSTGKTSFVMSLAAADLWGMRHFRKPGTYENVSSSPFTRPACWLLVTYENITHLRHLIDGFGVGHQLTQFDNKRLEILEFTSPMILTGPHHQTTTDTAQIGQIQAKAAELVQRTGLPVVIVIDNVTAAVSVANDEEQAKRFMQEQHEFARKGAAVLALAHPTKAATSNIGGHGSFMNLADNLAHLETLQRTDTGWLSWLSFEKNRTATDSWRMEVTSGRLIEPIEPFPRELSDGNTGYWEREQDRRRVPFIRQILMKRDHQKPKKTDVPPVHGQEPVAYGAPPVAVNPLTRYLTTNLEGGVARYETP